MLENNQIRQTSIYRCIYFNLLKFGLLTQNLTENLNHGFSKANKNKKTNQYKENQKLLTFSSLYLILTSGFGEFIFFLAFSL